MKEWRNITIQIWQKISGADPCPGTGTSPALRIQRRRDRGPSGCRPRSRSSVCHGPLRRQPDAEGHENPLVQTVSKEYQRTGDAKLKLMLRSRALRRSSWRIRIPVLVTAGSRDLIRRRETERIAAGIPGSRLKILKGEDHGSYIVHCGKLAELLVDFSTDANRPV